MGVGRYATFASRKVGVLGDQEADLQISARTYYLCALWPQRSVTQGSEESKIQQGETQAAGRNELVCAKAIGRPDLLLFRQKLV